MAHVDLAATVGSLPAQSSRRDVEPLSVTTRTTRSGAVVVAVCGEVDLTTSLLVRDRLVEHLWSTHHLVVDLGGVKLLCAAGLAALVVAREMALATGTGLCLVASTRQVRLPLVVTGLADVFDLHADLDAALLCPSARLPSSPAGPWLADPRQPGDLR